LRFCTALTWFWTVRGYLREGQSFLEQATALGESVPAPVKAKAFYTAAEFTFLLDDLERTEQLSNENLYLFRNLADTVGMADALLLLGTSAWARGRYMLARPQLEEAASLYQEMGENWKRGRCLTQLARISIVQGDYEQAQDLLEECLEIYRALGDKERLGWAFYLQARMLFLLGSDSVAALSLIEHSLTLLQEIDNPWARAYSLVLLGWIALQQDKPEKLEQARNLFEESRSSFKEVGDQGAMAEALLGLASVVTLQGDFIAAFDLYQESFRILQSINDKEFIPSCLEGLAAVEAEQGKLISAAHLWGASEALREAIGTPIPPVYRLSHEHAVAKVHALMSNDTFDEAWAEGRRMTPEQAMIRPS
jgi:tetratricopeptide (TPR) repeat protein